MDLLIWQMRKNCSLFITSGTLSQLTGNTSICNTSKIDFRRLEALFCGVWPSPDFSLLSSRISLQNRKKCRFEPTFKKACPARLSERKRPDFKRLSAGTGLTETTPKRAPPSQLHKRLEMPRMKKTKPGTGRVTQLLPVPASCSGVLKPAFAQILLTIENGICIMKAKVF